MKLTILFDLDGTLIDSTDAIVESFLHSFDYMKKKPPQTERITEKIGYTLEDIFAHLGVQSEEIDEYVASYKSHYRVISREKTFLLDGAKEAIELASSIAALGIVTTKTARYSEELLEHMDVMKFFDALIGRESVANVKPHPEPIFAALDKLGKNGAGEKKDIWMIGDTHLDVEAAKNAGVRHIALMTGYGDKNQLKSISDIVADDVLKAVEIIKNSC